MNLRNQTFRNPLAKHAGCRNGDFLDGDPVTEAIAHIGK